MGLEIKVCVCGQKIVFVQDAEDPEKTHPLDVSSPTYAVTWDENGLLAYKLGLVAPAFDGDRSAYLVSHFRTCTRVRDFAASRKKIEAGT